MLVQRVSVPGHRNRELPGPPVAGEHSHWDGVGDSWVSIDGAAQVTLCCHHGRMVQDINILRVLQMTKSIVSDGTRCAKIAYTGVSPTFSRDHVDLPCVQQEAVSVIFSQKSSGSLFASVCHLSMSKTSTRQNPPKWSSMIGEFGIFLFHNMYIYILYVAAIVDFVWKMGYPKTNQHFPR